MDSKKSKKSKKFTDNCRLAGVDPKLFPDSGHSPAYDTLPPTPMTGDPDCCWVFRYEDESKTPDCPRRVYFAKFFAAREEFVRRVDDDGGYIYSSTVTGKVVYVTPYGFVIHGN